MSKLEKTKKYQDDEEFRNALEAKRAELKPRIDRAQQLSADGARREGANQENKKLEKSIEFLKKNAFNVKFQGKDVKVHKH